MLANREGLTRAALENAFVKVLRSIGVTKRHCGPLEAALTQFLKVTHSYRAGLLHCYDDEALPRTNNDLEQCFGQHRFHERRATGRKKGALNAVLHGSVRLVAGVAPHGYSSLALLIWLYTTKHAGVRFASRYGIDLRFVPKVVAFCVTRKAIVTGLRPTSSSRLCQSRKKSMDSDPWNTNLTNFHRYTTCSRLYYGLHVQRHQFDLYSG